ncbi:hypothetical protein GCM10008171_21320 [Methylopila jiangsuensis]|uniref:Invasion associated locus B family protein n=1 Tax=Methylopila jiangsuensis TaxID=586230 RepID=A0A9W6JIJ8_9HYPH|nr:hypothetical protein [Methylopila jiangsuensis]MDR6286776.1 hypothetical protein [Methylopila jiangsuensis]GLK76878.1 hypothetical protein GCM10008171_21320 [Methylopila jiangsuensis]
MPIKNWAFAAIALGLAGPAFAQQAAAPAPAAPQAAPAPAEDNLPALNIEQTLGDVGSGWRKHSATGESVTYICDQDSCGGRGVLGVSSARPSEDYFKKIIADPQGALPSYKYGNDESMKATGCAFKTYEAKKLSDTRVRIDSVGGCPDGASAVMTTLFDAKAGRLLAVQVLTKGESAALKLRDDSADKIAKALDAL